MRRSLAAVLGLVALAAALRFWQLGQQSFWLDEAFTVDLVRRPFGDMLSGVAATESTPPLYYVLAWLWEKVFGHGEAGLRSLSALIGVATVPAAWAAAREWFDERAGVLAAALVAVNPFFVWYSQEARSYSLLVLTAALSLLFLAQRKPWWWALAAALALLTHYFAAFLVIPEALWLLWTARAWLPVAAVAAAGAALSPLALHQRDLGHTSFIADLSLKTRLTDLPKKLVTGELGTPTPLIGPLAGAIAALAIAYALSRAPRARPLLLVAAAAALVPLLATLAGADYLLPRNLIAVYVPIVLVAAAGLALAGRAGLAGAAAICVVAVVVNVEVASDAKLQRDDWRGAARALGRPATEPRAVVVTPEWERKPLRLYAGALPRRSAPVREAVAIATGRPPPRDLPAPPGFTEVGRKRTASYILVRYRSATPRVFPAAGARTAILLQSP